MASIITELIPDQPFEIIQNRIGEILLEEITAQHSLQNLDSLFKVFIERILIERESDILTISNKNNNF